MPTPIKIGLDLDGVIIDHTDNKLKLALERGFELENWQTNANIMHEYVARDAYEEIKRLVYAELTAEAPPTDQAIESLAKLPGELYVVSARRAATVRYAQDWLDRHRLYDLIPAERIFFCGDEAEKKMHCHRLGLQVYLDDKVKVLNLLPFSVRRTLFDCHGLADRLRPSDEINVVPGWPEFVRAVRKVR